MIRKTKKRPLSMLMVLTMVLSNFTGIGIAFADDLETEIAGYEETETAVPDETESILIIDQAFNESSVISFHTPLPFLDYRVNH